MLHGSYKSFRSENILLGIYIELSYKAPLQIAQPHNFWNEQYNIIFYKICIVMVPTPEVFYPQGTEPGKW